MCKSWISQVDQTLHAAGRALRRHFTRRGTRLIAAAIAGAAAAPAEAASDLSNVQSFVYSSGATAATPGFRERIQASPIQMFIVGYPGDTTDPAFSRSNIDPDRKKIILGGIDVAEGSQAAQPYLFVNGQPPSWFGGKFPSGEWYSVQYWHPEWKEVVLRQIDQLIAQGYDGAFLDVLYGDNEWEPGNAYGNPPYADRKVAMARLFSDIVAHVKAKNLPHFYLLAGNPAGIADTDPSLLTALDGVFFDGMFYISAGNGSQPSTAGLSWFDTYAAIYRRLGIPMFINDYPPKGDIAAALQAFATGNDRGWITTLDPENMPGDVYLNTGPFLMTAVGTSTVVTGSKSQRNLLSGGRVLSATLIGGDQGDHLFGGPGSNVIQGGAGDDVIYAHPASAVQKGLLTFDFYAHNTTALVPEAQITINGRMALPPTPITALDTSGTTQRIQIDPTPFGPIETLVISERNVSYAGSESFSNIRFSMPKYSNVPISFKLASFAGQSVSMMDGTLAELDAGGVITFPGSAFQVQAGFPADTRSVIDGGGGSNTLVYGANYTNYAVRKRADGVLDITSARTAEGPDEVRNVQTIQFSDRRIDLATALPLRNSCLFAYAAGTYPEIFSGTPTFGTYQQYSYALYAGSGNAVGIDALGGVWVLGPYTGGVLTFVGLETDFEPAVSAWMRNGHTDC